MNNSLQKEIMEDISWRYSEMSILRTLPYRYGLSEEHKEYLIRYSVPIIYSLWEGYVKTVFEIYVREINRLEMEASELNSKILAHAIDSEDKLHLQNPRTSHITKTEFTEYLLEFLDSKIIISPVIPTESNINYDTLYNIMNIFNIEQVSEQKYKIPLRRLLKFRNSVSHGDNSIPVKSDDIEKFCNLINDLITDVSHNLIDAFQNKSFLKN